MLQQRVAPSEQEAIRLRLGEVQHELAGLDSIDTQPPALDHSLFAHLCQGTERARAGCLELRQPGISVEVLGNVVDPYEVNAIDAESLQAVVNRTLRSVGRIVVDDLVGASELEEPSLLSEVTRSRLNFVENQPADLGAEQVVVTVVFSQRPSETKLRQAGAVQRRSVKIARPLLPGRIHGGSSFLVGDITKHVA